MDNNDPLTEAGEKLNAIMVMVDLMKGSKETAQRLEHTKFEDVSRTTWGEVVAQMQILQIVADQLIDVVPNAAKLLTNDALQAHLNAVMTAD